MSKEEWLDGYYPPVMEEWQSWQDLWSMGPHAEVGWVWFNGDYYTEEEARTRLANPPKDAIATLDDISSGRK